MVSIVDFGFRRGFQLLFFELGKVVVFQNVIYKVIRLGFACFFDSKEFFVEGVFLFKFRFELFVYYSHTLLCLITILRVFQGNRKGLIVKSRIKPFKTASIISLNIVNLRKLLEISADNPAIHTRSLFCTPGKKNKSFSVFIQKMRQALNNRRNYLPRISIVRYIKNINFTIWQNVPKGQIISVGQFHFLKNNSLTYFMSAAADKIVASRRGRSVGIELLVHRLLIWTFLHWFDYGILFK